MRQPSRSALLRRGPAAATRGAPSTESVPRTNVERPRPIRRRDLTGGYGYAIAIAAVLCALAVRAVLPPGLPFVTFYPAVILTAYFCGPRPAVVCAILSGLVAWYAVLPSNLPATGASSAAVALTLYGGVVGINLILFFRLQRTSDANVALARSERRLIVELQRETERFKTLSAIHHCIIRSMPLEELRRPQPV